MTAMPRVGQPILESMPQQLTRPWREFLGQVSDIEGLATRGVIGAVGATVASSGSFSVLPITSLSLNETAMVLTSGSLTVSAADAGWYLAYLRIAPGGNYTQELAIRVNGAYPLFTEPVAQYLYPTLSGPIKLATADVVGASYLQTSGGSVAVTGDLRLVRL